MTIFSQISRSVSETVIVRWAHTARQFVSIEFSFHPYNILRDYPRGVPRGNKNVVKIAIFGLTHWLKHRITRKLLKIDRYIAARGLAGIELSFHPCNILRDSRRGVSRGNHNVGRFFALAVRITGKLLKLEDRCCETICKHRILFPSIQHLAWLPQGRPQGETKMC